MGKDKKRDKYEKELAKLHETDEEKRARRLAKKAKKEAKRGADPALSEYTNEANPWGDSHLTEGFVWGKKLEKDRTNGVADSGSREAQKRRRAELAVELQKVKRARELREAEKEAWEDERRMLEREREQMAYVDNEQREDRFQLEQSKLRAHIRVREGRARPIDVLSESLALLADDCPPERALETELQEPIRIFDELNEREFAELAKDIGASAELDTANGAFWNAMAYLGKHLLAEHLSMEAGQKEYGLHAEVQSDVLEMLRGKNARELEELEEQLEERLSGGETLDSDYWEGVLKQLRVAKARATLNGTYAQLKQRRLELCGGGGRAAAAVPVAEAADDAEVAGATAPAGEQPSRFSPELLPDGEEVDFGSDDELAAPAQAAEASGSAGGGAEEEAAGRYSPVLLTALQVNRAEAVDETEDYRQLEALRARVKARAMDKGGDESGGAAGDEHLVSAESRKGFEQGEARFSFEIPLEQKVAWWHDKYRPRKPKYFNRVHTGYEWNKYNQTHYDHDNPPPKMVQGYKFNVFYPDLIDRKQTPTYRLEPDPSGAKDTCILRFHGGPPYEDLAFKIVNREWETNHKRGFKCRFERGILQLFFNFRKHRYRR